MPGPNKSTMNTSGEQPTFAGITITTTEGWEAKAAAAQSVDVRLGNLETVAAKGMVEIANINQGMACVISRLGNLEAKARAMMAKEEAAVKPAPVWRDAETDPPKQSGAYLVLRPALFGSDCRSVLWFDTASREWGGTLNYSSISHWMELPPPP